MARNGSGVYTKVNTFSAGNTITAAGHNQNWDDLVAEITNSVAADGQTTISAALKGFAGTVSAPGYSFSSDLNTGMYRIGADNIGLACNGTKVLDVATTGLGVTGALTVSTTITITGVSTFSEDLRAADGDATTPSYGFTNDTDCGWYRIGANNLGLALNGSKVLDAATTGIAITGTLSASSTLTASNGFTVSSGSVSLPAGSVANAALAVPPARVKLKTTTLGVAAASVEFGTSGNGTIDSTYRVYEIEWHDILAASGTPTLLMEVSDDTGSSWETANYTNYFFSHNGTASTHSSSTANVAMGSMANGAGQGTGGSIKIYSPSSVNYTRMEWRHAAVIGWLGHATFATTAIIDAVRFTTSSGNFAAGSSFTLYGWT